MKKITALLMALLMMLSMSAAMAESNPYAVTEPITIEWWHSNEDQYTEDIKKLEAMFEAEYPMIDVVPMYIGSGATLAEQLIAAHAADSVPAVSQCNVGYLAEYASSGVTTNLEPYFEAYGINKDDFVKGYRASATLAEDGNMYSFPFLASTQVIYYNKTIAQAEGITMPTTWEEMDAFMEKATVKNADGTTARYAMVFGGWGSQYFETFFTNYGVEVIKEDGTSGVADEVSIEIVTKIKEWIDKGYAYYAYGTGASSNMRQLFWDGGAFSVFHTSSLYDTYVTNVGDSFEVGMAWLPGGNDGETFKSEVGGAAILIPAAASQAEKNAAWQFLMFMTSPEINLYWADKTGYFPTRASVQGTPEYEEYLSRKPAMADIVAMAGWINPRNQNPAYDACANLGRTAMYEIFNNNAPIQETLDQLAVEIQETLDDQ